MGDGKFCCLDILQLSKQGRAADPVSKRLWPRTMGQGQAGNTGLVISEGQGVHQKQNPLGLPTQRATGGP